MQPYGGESTGGEDLGFTSIPKLIHSFTKSKEMGIGDMQ